MRFDTALWWVDIKVCFWTKINKLLPSYASLATLALSSPIFSKIHQRFRHCHAGQETRHGMALRRLISHLAISLKWPPKICSFPEWKAPRELIVYCTGILHCRSVHNFKRHLWNDWAVVAKFPIQPPGPLGMKSCYNGLGHMTKIATMPIYGKKTLKIFYFRTNRWPWNLVCSIVYASTTKIIQIMILDWPWLTLRQGQIWSHRLLHGQKWKLCIIWNLLQP